MIENYSSLVRQADLWREELSPSFLTATDCSKIKVQRSAGVSPTEQSAMQLLNLEKAEAYNRLWAQVKGIQHFVLNIKDAEVREIAIRRCQGQTYEKIATAMFIDRTTASKKLRKYISHNSH